MSAPPPSASERLSGTPRSVLLVDDEDAVRAALKRFFTRRGWTVVEAADGESAKALLDPVSGHRFDLLICDLAMPRVSGVELYRWLARFRRDALSRLVFSSGDVTSEEITSFLREAGRPILPKPFELAELARIVEDVTRAAHAA